MNIGKGKLLVGALCAALLSTPTGPRAEPVETFSGKVVGIADGDTVTVLRGKIPTKVRLHGIDCPEAAQPFGQRAKQRTARLVFGRVVTVEVRTRDRYGRLVGTVGWRGRHGRRLLREALLRDGLAWWYRQYAPEDRRLARLEAEARRRRRGLWADPQPTPPWAWRRARRAASHAPSSTEASRGTYHGNSKRKVVHGPGCKHYHCKHCTARFSTVAQAEQAGYRPHAACLRANNAAGSRCKTDGDCAIGHLQAGDCGVAMLRREAERLRRETERLCAKGRGPRKKCGPMPGCIPGRLLRRAVCRAGRCEGLTTP